MKKYERSKKDSSDYRNCEFCKIEGSIIENNLWFVIGNRAPYDVERAKKKESRHLLLLPKHHITSLLELTKTSRKAMVEMQEKILKVYKELYGSCVMFVRQNTHAQSMFHLHWHILDEDYFMEHGIPNPRPFFDYEVTDRELKWRLRKIG